MEVELRETARMFVLCLCLVAAGCGGRDPMSKYERRDDRVAEALSDNDEVGLLGNKAV